METGRVGEGEDDWTLDVFGHFADDFFGEGSGDGGTSDQDVRFDVFDDGEEVAFAFGGNFVVVSSKRFLGGG